MSQRPIDCPGCLYSGQPHLETCEHSYARTISNPMHMYVWTREPFFFAVAQAHDVASARKLLLDECGGTDGSCPERAEARKWIAERNPSIWYGPNAEFALTDSAELRENELLLETLQKQLAELKKPQGGPARANAGKPFALFPPAEGEKGFEMISASMFAFAVGILTGRWIWRRPCTQVR
jgi:hypothetical protein